MPNVTCCNVFQHVLEVCGAEPARKSSFHSGFYPRRLLTSECFAAKSRALCEADWEWEQRRSAAQLPLLLLPTLPASSSLTFGNGKAAARLLCSVSHCIPSPHCCSWFRLSVQPCSVACSSLSAPHLITVSVYHRSLPLSSLLSPPAPRHGRSQEEGSRQRRKEEEE